MFSFGQNLLQIIVFENRRCDQLVNMSCNLQGHTPAGNYVIHKVIIIILLIVIYYYYVITAPVFKFCLFLHGFLENYFPPENSKLENRKLEIINLNSNFEIKHSKKAGGVYYTAFLLFLHIF